jgi:hypothetical protein
VKVIVRGYGIGMTNNEKLNARVLATTLTITRGTTKVPSPPRDLFVQPGPRGILLNWRFPEGYTADIAGWRVYKGDEQSLFAEIRDPLTTQWFVESTAGTTPPNVMLFVSSFNKIGVESTKLSVTGSATAETGAPSTPTTPPIFSAPFVQPGYANPKYRGY